MFTSRLSFRHIAASTVALFIVTFFFGSLLDNRYKEIDGPISYFSAISQEMPVEMVKGSDQITHIILESE